jgi:hypothetical protein
MEATGIQNRDAERTREIVIGSEWISVAVPPGG